MKIIAKNKFDNNIYDKISKGTDAIEIHLDEDFITNPMKWDKQIVKDVEIAAVHAPLLGNGNDMHIEDFRNRQMLVKTCDFARRIADAQNHSVMVILHLGTDPEVLKESGTYDDFVIFMRDLAINYEQLEFAIENVGPFDVETSRLTGHIGFRAVRFDSSVRFAKDVGHPRVGTCLDTCHALMEIEFLRSARIHFNLALNCGPESKPMTITDFFEANKDTIKWIHLANSKFHGMGEFHGLPFTDDDEGLLKHIMWLYKDYKYNCPITIEVQEKDYSDAQNYKMTYETLSRVKKDLNL